MHPIADIQTLNAFRENAAEHIKRLRATGRPELLTIDGEAAVVVQDAESYQKLLDAVDRIEAMTGIGRGLTTMDRGEGRPARAAMDAIRRKHNIPTTDQIS